MAPVACQCRVPASRPARTGAVAGSANTNRSSTMLVSSTTWPAAGTQGSSTSGSLRRITHGPGGFGAGRLVAHAATNQVKAEQAAFDGPVPHGHPTRLLEPHAARQLEVGGQHPGLPAGIVLLPMAGQLHEEFAAIFGLGRFTAAARLALAGSLAGHPSRLDALTVGWVEQHHTGLFTRRHALQGIATAQLHGVGHAGPLGVALGEVDHTEGH